MTDRQDKTRRDETNRSNGYARAETHLGDVRGQQALAKNAFEAPKATLRCSRYSNKPRKASFCCDKAPGSEKGYYSVPKYNKRFD